MYVPCVLIHTFYLYLWCILNLGHPHPIRHEKDFCVKRSRVFFCHAMWHNWNTSIITLNKYLHFFLCVKHVNRIKCSRRLSNHYYIQCTIDVILQIIGCQWTWGLSTKQLIMSRISKYYLQCVSTLIVTLKLMMIMLMIWKAILILFLRYRGINFRANYGVCL